jgi:CTP-dependent riboflavin kinase
MKTISDCAKLYNVSVQTIYRKIDKGVKQDGKQGLTEKRGNITYITPAGEDFLYSCLTPVERDLTNVEQVLNTDKSQENSENEEVLFLRKQLEKTQDELNTEREHSRAVATQLVEITRNNQILLKAEQDRANPALPTASDEPPLSQRKRGFFGLFGRK